MEKLIIPLIHFVLLAFLPLRRMRTSTDPRFGAACGQIVAVRRDAYESVGGHAEVAHRLHEAVALARLFRSRNLTTDLFDATDIIPLSNVSNGSGGVEWLREKCP